ncbi:peptidoglycan editing factor PgeF [Microcoleus sp. FACHB-1515]|uniref:peptidoglycan editing factor PgeF n=1 Tax=Cyanophyceae TaxID=3028117 RepID=UPI001683F42E|nr:peptidoglycan editing factor PgeF [Microcoleus sp. FACHB-1515]MBD2089325.1 peptidoglycan editing factor PgeF [Microcoleus sp. FACHB-1515]
MHHWYWENCEGLSYLRCSLLDAWPHGFFTRQFAPRRPESLTPLLDRTASVNWVRQVHGNVVLSPDEIEANETDTVPGALRDRSPADGVISTQANQAVWVATADCVPAIIADVATGQVAAVHAGWRGTSLRIVPAAIARLQAQGSQIEHLRVALGPAIAGEVYQVSTSCAAEVAASIFPEIEDEVRLEKLAQLPQSPLLSDPQVDRVRLDVRGVNRIQLQQLGLVAEQIATAPFCTFQDADDFFSYRRERLKQVQWSGIVSR